MKAVILYGPPGSGKGTQANLLALTNNFVHFDTGKFLEATVNNPELLKKSKLIREQKKLFDTGILCDPAFVLDIVKNKTKEIAEAKLSIAYSGSPRTMYEAFGDGKQTGLYTILRKLYGKNVYIFIISVKPQTSIRRNSARLICNTCGIPAVVWDSNKPPKHCLICGATFRKRSLDKAEIIKVRLKEYANRTLPIIKEAKKHGFIVNQINGEQKPFKVFEQIIKRLESRD